MQQYKWKSMIFTSHSQEPAEPDKDNYHHIILGIDTIITFGMIDSPNRSKTISFQREVLKSESCASIITDARKEEKLG